MLLRKDSLLPFSLEYLMKDGDFLRVDVEGQRGYVDAFRVSFLSLGGRVILCVTDIWCRFLVRFLYDVEVSAFRLSRIIVG